LIDHQVVHAEKICRGEHQRQSKSSGHSQNYERQEPTQLLASEMLTGRRTELRPRCSSHHQAECELLIAIEK
jgi:hypothetical protein